MKKKRTVWGLALTALVACFSFGCSQGTDKAAAEMEQQPLSRDLKRMQGQWSAASAEGMFDFKARIDGYRVLLSYRHAEDGDLLRNSCVFERVDELRKCFVMYENRGAWPYSLSREEAQDKLELKFLCTGCAEWHVVSLHQSPEAIAAAR